MYRSKLVLSLLLAVSLVAMSLETKEEKKFVGVKGKEIIGTDGKPILLKGINLGNWLVPEGYMFKFKKTSSPRLINQAFVELIGPEKSAAYWDKYLNTYITKEDILYIRKLGFNHVRVPFNYRMLTDEYYLGRNNRGYDYLDKVISWCKEAQLYVLLDMHCAPCGQTGDNIDDGEGYPFLFESEQCQQQMIRIWKDIATRYRDESIVLGYDLMNEPIAHYFDNRDTLNKELVPLYKDLVKAIRKVDTNHLIFLGGAQWNTNFRIFEEPFDNKLVYTFHKYWMPAVKGEIQEYINYSNKYNVPVYLGESGENTDEWVRDFRSLLEENNIGWCFWPYKKMDNSRCVVTFDTPENYNKLVVYADSSRRSFEEVRKGRVDLPMAEEILQEFNRNSTFDKCRLNKGFAEALGMNPADIQGK